MPEFFRLIDYLPALYRDVLPDFFRREIPRESRATCHDCVMLGDPGLPPEFPSRNFNAETKCCTYHPSLPNFLVGALLASEETDMALGREKMRAKIAHGLSVTPRGVLTPRKFALFYDQSQGTFGTAPALKCPYLHEGNCGIWRFRDAICTTWFCKYERGAPGKRFWEELKRYLTLAEHRLSLHCVTRLIDDPTSLQRNWDGWDGKGTLTPEDLADAPPPEADRRALWGKWRGREEAFYRECFAIVSALTAGDVERILGVEETFLRAKLLPLMEKASRRDLPPRLRRNPELCVIRRGDGYLVANQASPGEALEIHALFYPLLEWFDGTDVEAVLSRIEKEKGMVVPREMIATLFYRGVLVE